MLVVDRGSEIKLVLEILMDRDLVALNWIGR